MLGIFGGRPFDQAMVACLLIINLVFGNVEGLENLHSLQLRFNPYTQELPAASS